MVQASAQRFLSMVFVQNIRSMQSATMIQAMVRGVFGKKKAHNVRAQYLTAPFLQHVVMRARHEVALLNRAATMINTIFRMAQAKRVVTEILASKRLVASYTSRRAWNFIVAEARAGAANKLSG